MMDDITTKLSGDILWVTLNRPDEGNAATDAMALELTRVLHEASGQALAVVLRGAGADFCVGRASMGQKPTTKPEALERRRANDVVFACYDAIRKSPVPVVAAVQGRALGFGCAVVSACDIVLAADTATFQIPEIRHGIMPTMVLSAVYDRMPQKALAYAVLSTEPFDAARAMAWGLVSEVVPEAELNEAAECLAAQLATVPRPALEGVKEFLRVAPGMPREGAVDYARSLHAMVNSSSEMRRK